MTWICPRCDRAFGATNRPHTCLPGMPVEVWLAERTDPQRRAAEAVLAVVEKIPGLIVEAVSIGVLIKRGRTIVELRPKTRWLQLSFVSRDAIASERIARELDMPDAKLYYVRLHDETDVDAAVRAWLRAALRARTGAHRPRT